MIGVTMPVLPRFFKSEEARPARVTLATPVRIGGAGVRARARDSIYIHNLTELIFRNKGS